MILGKWTSDMLGFTMGIRHQNGRRYELGRERYTQVWGQGKQQRQ